MSEYSYFAIHRVRIADKVTGITTRVDISKVFESATRCVASAYNKMRQDLDQNVLNLMPATVALPSEGMTYEWLLELTPEEVDLFDPIIAKNNNDDYIKMEDGKYRIVVPCIYEMRSTHVPPERTAREVLIALVDQTTAGFQTTYDQLFVMRIPRKGAEYIYDRLKAQR